MTSACLPTCGSSLLHYEMSRARGPGFPSASVDKESAHNTEDLGSIPDLRRSPGVGNGSPLQYSCLGNPMGREAWPATVHGVTKCWTRLSNGTAQHRGLRKVLASKDSEYKLTKSEYLDYFLVFVGCSLETIPIKCHYLRYVCSVTSNSLRPHGL